MFYAHYLISTADENSQSGSQRGDCQKTGSLSRLATKRFLNSRKALAIPITYLILFTSLLAVISATYSYAIVKIGSKGAQLSDSIASRNMQSLDDAIRAIAWSHSSSEVLSMQDCGGSFYVSPTSRHLALTISDGQSFTDMPFNGSIGRVFSSIPPSDLFDDGMYIRGDDRSLVNQTSSSITQLSVESRNEGKQIALSYRPSFTSAAIGFENDRPQNLIRINLVALSCSRIFLAEGQFNLRITSVNVSISRSSYQFNQSVSAVSLISALDGKSTYVSIPIDTSPAGTVVQLEIVVSRVDVQELEA